MTHAFPPALRTDTTNAFAHDTMRRRAPIIAREVSRLKPDYPAAIHARLEALAHDLETDAPLPPFPLPAPDGDLWQPHIAARQGETWGSTDWFFAEVYFYRLIIDAVRWWETGRDPFALKKDEEWNSAALWEGVEGALAIRLQRITREMQIERLIGMSLWGNRIDLSHQSKDHGMVGTADDLLIDDRMAAVVQILAHPGKPIHIIADNAGSELAMDCALADFLLDAGYPVTIHLKMHPTFVSDAIPAEFWIFLNHAEVRGEDRAMELTGRLRDAWAEGRLRLAPDLFWNRPDFLHALPERVSTAFAYAALVIVKGDANYRRIVGDAIYAHDATFADALAYFPAPLLALRTLKSDPLVGISAEQSAILDGLDTEWRVNGRRGVVQFKG